MSDCGLPARLSLMILTDSSVEFARVERTLMPYFFSKAALMGRTSCAMIWVVYQVTSPSFFAASIKAASAAWAELEVRQTAKHETAVIAQQRRFIPVLPSVAAA